MRSKIPGGLAQLARAPALHAGGQRFDSVILHYYLMTDCLLLDCYWRSSANRLIKVFERLSLQFYE